MINPFSETVDSVRQFFYGDLDMNILEDDKEKMLFIIDALETYFDQDPDSEFKERMALYSKEIGKEGLQY